MREAVRLLAWAAIGAACLVTDAAAAPLVSGRVTARNGPPLSGVQVQVEIRRLQTAKPTDEQGHFEFDGATLFDAGELRDAGGLMLEFSKAGYQPVNKLVRLSTGQAPAPVTVQLDPTNGSAALDSAEKEALRKYIAAPGSAPLFLLPYSLSGITGDATVINDMLRANLERVIITHLQASDVSQAGMVSLKLLPGAQANDLDRLRAYGTYLGALGVITGYGAVEAAGGAPATLDVSSTFLIIPEAAPLKQPVLYVDDDLPADRVASPRLYQHLSKLWGRSAVLALGVSQFASAKAAGDKEALKRVRSYLQAERAGAGPGDEALVPQVGALIEAVDKELAP